ncbi:ROK family protein [Lactococcus hircilactis]|uniref:Fructokinase n=1 Tax=Lactococcus hircilactis TaxID=1494462 RepID=A0A7X1Z7Y7_9LACT|nr:fructokinase ScrK [Lactococcus hircilactis]MQW39438.1 ROK family protein [Lactococcus hircilactis]
MNKYYGSIEAGGTKFVLAIADQHYNLIHQIKIPTTSPKETLAATIDYFTAHPVSAIGIGSFGPLDLNIEHETYGFITSTPKKGWAQIDLLGQLKSALHIPISLTTDVNASAYGEMMDTGIQNLVYFTIGTGIGGGAIQDGHFIGGISHAEMGHQLVKRHPDDLDFAGTCPFHGDCLEGVAAGPSLMARTGVRGETLPIDHPIWEIQAYYIAQAALNATLTLAPECIVLGGGVMDAPQMIPLVREDFKKLLHDYIELPCPLEDYLRLPSVPENGSATLGNFAQAQAICPPNKPKHT